MDTEHRLKRLIRRSLPPAAFERQPVSILSGVAIAVVLLTGVWLIATQPIPWPIGLVGSVFLGNIYAAFMFFGHEVGHGAVVRNRRARATIMWFTMLIYMVSPHLWEHWHNRAHHRHTNVPHRDPDTWRPLADESLRSGLFACLARRIAPGSGHWLSALNLFIAFTLQGQLVLWRDSGSWAWRGFDRTRAKIEFCSMLFFWLLLASALGARVSIFAILIPMLVANVVIMAYVSTNHMLRPKGQKGDVLDRSMSVRTLGVLDRMHLHFSHHVEHHLFPGTSHRFYPQIRELLQRHAGDRYVAPGHWRALRVLFATPPSFDPARGFVNSITGDTVSVQEVEDRLQGETGV